jgi:hypothetical protein
LIMLAAAESQPFMRFPPGESAMSSMARMAVFVVMGSALTVGALIVANYLATSAG